MPYPVEKVVEKKVPHPFPVIKEIKVPVFIQSPQKYHHHQQQQHQNQQQQQHQQQQQQQQSYDNNQLKYGESFFAGSKKHPNMQQLKHQKGNEDFLTRPTDQDEDVYRRNLKIVKHSKPKPQNNQLSHQNNQVVTPSNIQTPQTPSGFQLAKEQPHQQNILNKPSESYIFQEQYFPSHTQTPVQDQVTQASTQYEAYSQHPRIQYVQHPQPQYYQQEQEEYPQQNSVNQMYYQQQQHQEPQYQIQYPVQYMQYQQQQQSSNNDFQPSYGSSQN